MAAKKNKWEFIYQEREVALFPFYLFAKAWGVMIKSILGKNLSPIVLIFSKKGVDYYVNKSEFSLLGKRAYNLFLNSHFYRKMTRNVDKYSSQLNTLAGRIEKQRLSQVNDERLVIYIKKLDKIMLQLNKWGQLLSLTEYGLNDYTTQGLLAEIERKMKKIKHDLTPVQISRLLSLPIRSSYFRKERLDLLKIAVYIKENKLTLTSPRVKKVVAAHRQKYSWISYGYVGPVLETDYFFKELKDLLKKRNLEKVYYDKKNELRKVLKEQQELEKELSLSKLIKKRFFIVRDQTYYKEYRKEVLFHGFYACELIQKELAKRWQAPVKAFRYLLPHEHKQKMVIKLYQQRRDLNVYCLKNSREFVYTGDEAEKIIATIRKTDKNIEEVKELKGNAAFLGEVRGNVKIVMGVDHLGKVKRGDILVSFSTNPQMVPTMKIAGAIVTEQGGITSHAAIVSREMQIPCIVGVRDATRILRDGDKVRVNANKGVITKI